MIKYEIVETVRNQPTIFQSNLRNLLARYAPDFAKMPTSSLLTP
jgi:hypothetical protein